MLLLLALVAFPSQRIANLPTGRILEPGYWQLAVSHRFFSPDDNKALEGNLLNFLTGPTVRVTFDRAFTRSFAGVAAGNGGHELGLRAGYAPWQWTTLHAEVSADVIDLKQKNVWAGLTAALPWTPARFLHLVAAPQVTASTESLFVSLGLGALADIGQGLSVGLEAEPLLVGNSDKLAWNLALDKELGWHNFTLVCGNAYYQHLPARFSRANRDITKGYFRVGFNILRRF